MKMIRTFSGMHAFRQSCLRFEIERGLNDEAQAGNGDVDEIESDADEIEEQLLALIETEKCPRCEGGYQEKEIPSGSRVSACRCIPVCWRCGRQEPHVLWAPNAWPIGQDIAAFIDTQLAQGMKPAMLVRGSDGTTKLLHEDGVGDVDMTPSTGGWLQFGSDEDDAVPPS